MNDVEAIVSVYQQTRPPYKHRVVYAPYGSGTKARKREKHIITLDATKWIEMVLVYDNKKMAVSYIKNMENCILKKDPPEGSVFPHSAG